MKELYLTRGGLADKPKSNPASDGRLNGKKSAEDIVVAVRRNEGLNMLNGTNRNFQDNRSRKDEEATSSQNC